MSVPGAPCVGRAPGSIGWGLVPGIVSIPNNDKDRIKGAGEQAKGAVKEPAGKVTRDAKLEAEGKVDKAAGKAQSTIGDLKDTLRGK